MTHEEKKFASRGGLKLDHALDHFNIDCTGRICADLGCNVGGFTDCMLQHGASHVYAVDTGYGELAWTLRKDDRVTVMERTNALHVELPETVSMITIDVAWTRQDKIIPAARKLLDKTGLIVSLIKPHYESPNERLQRGVLKESLLTTTIDEVRQRLADLGFAWENIVESPIQGQKGNREYLALFRF